MTRPAAWTRCITVGLVVLGVAADAVAQRRPVDVVRFRAPSVDREMTYAIVLPEGYDDPAQAERRYPTLYLLHGYGNAYEGWSRFLGIPTYARDHDLIIVMPDAGNSYYVNWARTDDGRIDAWEDYITRDVVGHVETHYRALARRAARAIAGFSMGGYGALTIGLRHPDLFVSVGSQSGALAFGRRAAERIRTGQEALPPRRFTPEQQARRERPHPLLDLPGFSSVTERSPVGQPFLTIEQAMAHDPFALVRTVPRTMLPRIQIDCGRGDALLPITLELADRLRREGIPSRSSSSTAGTTPAYWIQAYGYAIAWHHETMVRALGLRPVVTRR